jgi:DNA repair protein RadD
VLKLYGYQQRDVNRLRECFADGNQRVLYQAPTGSGKTVLFAHIVAGARARNNRVVILGHRQEIVDQITDALTKLGVKHGVIAAGYPEKPSLMVQVASVATLTRHLDRLHSKTKLLIVDEAHHITANTWKEIIAAMPDVHVLGVTATPERLDGWGLDNIFNAMVIGPTTGELIEAGYLSNFVTYAPATLPDLSRLRTRMGDYVVSDLAAVMSKESVVQPAVDDYVRLCPGVPAIAFCVDIEHSQRVAEHFIAAGYKAAHVDGKTPKDKRRSLIHALGTGGLQILCNCGIVSEGLDVPSVVAVILLRPTQSLALYLQQVGRALRPAPGKARALILDHTGNTVSFGLPDMPREWSLKGGGKWEYEWERGSRISARRCTACGALNPISASTCSECGAELHKLKPVEVEQCPTRYGRDPCGSYGDDPCTSKGWNRRCHICSEPALPWPFQDPANPQSVAHGRVNDGCMWDLICEGCYYKDLTPEEKTQRDKTAVRLGTRL